MSFQNVVLSRASFYTTFLNLCGRGEDLGYTTCLRTVVWVSKGMLPVEYFHSNKAFLCQSNFIEIIRLLIITQSCGKSGHPHFLIILPDLKCWSLLLLLPFVKLLWLKFITNQGYNGFSLRSPTSQAAKEI